MILRHAILSEQSRALEPVRSSSPPVPSSRPVEPVTVAPEPALRASVPREAPLTFEAVAAWLAVQDGETRIACASILADELTHVHETAKADGRALGEAQGREEAQRQVQATIDALERVTAKAQTACDDEAHRLADLCTDIVAEVFFKIGGRALVDARSHRRVSVGEVLKRVARNASCDPSCSPADLAVLRTAEAGSPRACPAGNSRWWPTRAWSSVAASSSRRSAASTAGSKCSSRELCATLARCEVREVEPA